MGCFDAIWDIIESVSEDFPSYFSHMDDTNAYAIEGFIIIRNDQPLNNNAVRPPHGSALTAFPTVLKT